MTSAATFRRSYALAVIALAGAAGCGVLAWWSQHHLRVALIVAMALLAPAPFVIRAWQHRWDPFEPINLMAIGIIVIFVARPIAELKLHLEPYYPLYSSRPGFNGAMEIALLGTACLYLGYFWRAGVDLGRRFKPLPDQWDVRRSIRFTVWMLIIGAMLTLLFIAQVGLSAVLDIFTGRASNQAAVYRASSAYFQQGPYLAIPASFILLVAWSRRRSFLLGVMLAVTVLFTLLITVPNGDRTFILELSLPMITLWYLRRGRRPRVLSILAAFVVLVLFANVEVSLRNKATRHGQSAPAVILKALANPGSELEHFIAGADPSEFSVLAIEKHAYDIGALKRQPGSTARSIAIGWIPHQLLGSKPLTPLQYVSWTLFPATAGFSSYGPSMFGSMYADYGWISVAVLSLFVGVALRAIWEYFRRRLDVGGMQLVFAGALPLVVILLRDDIDDIVYRSVFLAIPLLACVILCSRPSRIKTRYERFRGHTSAEPGSGLGVKPPALPGAAR